MNDDDIKSEIIRFIRESSPTTALVAIGSNRNMFLVWSRYSMIPSGTSKDTFETWLYRDRKGFIRSYDSMKYYYDETDDTFKFIDNFIAFIRATSRYERT